MRKSLGVCLLAMAAWAGAARALPPQAAPDYVIYAVGGDNGVAAVQAVARQLLSQVDIYSADPVAAHCDNAANYSAQWFIAYGSTAAALADGHGGSIPAGKNVLLLYRSDETRVLPAVATAVALGYPAPAAIAAATSDGCGVAPAYHLQTGFATVSAVPDFGLAGMDLATLNYPVNLAGSYTAVGSGQSRFVPGTPLKAAQLAAVTQWAVQQYPYGLALTDTLYAGTSAFPHPKTAFGKPEIVALLTGGVTDWSQLRADDGTALPAQPVVWLDTAPGSAAKAAGNNYFLDNPGASRAGGALVAYNQSSIAGGPTASAPASGCSSYADINEPSSTALRLDLQALNSAGCRAAGLVELQPPGSGFHYAVINRLDPFAPLTDASGQVLASYANELSGSYDLFYSGSLLARNRSINGGGWYGDGGYRSVLIAQFAQGLQGTALPAGGGGAVPGLLLDPALSGAADPCTTTGSRFAVALAPLQLLLDATLGAPACAESLRPGGPNLLNNSSHAAFDGELVANLVGQGVWGTSLFVDSTQPAGASPQFVTLPAMLDNAINPSNVYYVAGTSTAVNHHPYRIVSTSASGYNLALEIQDYADAVSDNVISNMAYVGGSNGGVAGQPPPVAMTVVDFCQDSPVSYGTEFCVNQGYHQAEHCFTDSPSNTTNCFAQFLAALGYKHPRWNNFDLIAAFQETAANWSSGYNHATYGYGAVNFENATAIASSTAACAASGTPASICLRPPLLLAQKSGCQGQFALLPNLTTRRRAGGYEAIYSVNPAYGWPQKNEYTAADLAAAGATLLYASNGSDVTPIYNYTPTAVGTVSFAAFTTDGKGRYSRMEAEFGVQQLSFTASDVPCTAAAAPSRPAAQVFHSTVIKRQ
jgi:hypothetical protein